MSIIFLPTPSGVDSGGCSEVSKFKNYCVCKECGNPEFDYFGDFHETFHEICQKCGNKTWITDVVGTWKHIRKVPFSWWKPWTWNYRVEFWVQDKGEFIPFKQWKILYVDTPNVEKSLGIKK